MNVASNPATSIILPTTSYNEVIEQLSSQLSEKDELIVVYDTEKDPIADSDIDSKSQVKLLEAGEPEGCSGKANAIYHGMKAAENNRIVWTDDDFHHPEDWLEELHKTCNKHGAVSELPFFIGQNPLTIINEPTYALVMFITYLNNQVWGGAVMFDRDQFDEETFLKELKSTVGDDVLLSEHLNSKTLRKTRRVEIDETVTEALERLARFVKHVRYHEPIQSLILGVVSVILAVLCISFPLYSLAGSSVLYFGIYQILGENRLTFLFSYVSLLILPILLTYGVLKKSFVWHGRRLKYNSKLDVEILERGLN